MSILRIRCLLPALVFCLIALEAHANTFTSTLQLAALPTTLTLCRDKTAIQQYGIDEQWAVLIDVDGNPATGGPGGYDVIIAVQTLPQTNSCTATIVNTADALQAGVGTWNNGTQLYDFGSSPQIALDFNANTITLATDLAGGLANLGSTSVIIGSSVATYSTTTANDATDPIGPNATTTDPSGDVGNCSGSCSAGASYYDIIDLVGLTTKTSSPIDAFGSNTLTFEFDLSSLPTNIGLCRYPAAFAASPGVDSFWLALIDADNNPSTGLGGYETGVIVVTPPQPSGCSTSSAPIATALSAQLATIDGSGNISPFGDPLPLTIDQPGGRLLVQVDRTVPQLSTFSAGPVSVATQATYGVGTFANDQTGIFHIGESVTDPAVDVANCSGACSPAQSWYPQTDLIGAALRRPNNIFSATFD